MVTKTEVLHAGGFLVSELAGFMSRMQGVLVSGQNLGAGVVLGQILTAGAATAVGSPTGNGAITVGAIGPAAIPGVYKLVCVAAASGAGTFNFQAPDGTLIRQVTVAAGAHANDHMPITIADATDFVVGDTFSITVAAGKFTALAPAGTDGSQTATGILFAAKDASSADANCAVVSKMAVVNAAELVWPVGISVGNKATAIAQLAARGFVLR
jgi:hypothetical protein